MPETGFKSLGEIKEAARAIVEFAEDVAYARVFESHYSDSNLFGIDDGRLDKLARVVEPDLDDDEYDLDKIIDALPFNLEARARGGAIATKEAFFQIGIFLGACIADRSGAALSRLSDGWIRATLAQPRHKHLEPKRKRAARAKPAEQSAL